MSRKQQSAVSAPSAAEVCSRFTPSADASRLLRDDLPPNEYAQVLFDHDLYSDGVKFLAHSLPVPQCVWWGCLCVWQALRPHPAPAAAAALAAVLRWLRESNEETRRAVEAAGRAAGANTPAGCLALAAFWSEGSMAPPNVPSVMPPPHLTARAVASAVLLAGAPERTVRLRQYFTFANEVASGNNTWKQQ